MRGIVKFGTYPVAVKFLRGLICRASASKRIEDDITRLRRDKYGSFRDYQFQFIDTWPDLELRMPIWRCIGPEVRQIYSLRVHLVSMTTVIPDFLATMSAFFYRKSDLVEHPRGTSGEIEKRIVSRIQLLSTWICAFHGQCYPMSELQSFSHDRGKMDCKFRCSVEEKCTSGFQYTAAFKNPYSAPTQIFVSRDGIVVTILVVFPQVEWRIGKHGVDHFRFHVPKNVNAVRVIEDPMRRGQEWLLQLTGSWRIILFAWWEVPGGSFAWCATCSHEQLGPQRREAVSANSKIRRVASSRNPIVVSAARGSLGCGVCSCCVPGLVLRGWFPEYGTKQGISMVSGEGRCRILSSWLSDTGAARGEEARSVPANCVSGRERSVESTA